MQRFKNVLLVIDEKSESRAALPQAVALCHRNRATLTLVNVVDDSGRDLDLSFAPDFLANLKLEQLESRRNCLEELAEPLRAEGMRVNTRVLVDWISGVTKVTGTTQLYSYKGKTTIDGNTLPSFADSTGKYAYRVEVLWDGYSK